MITDSEVMFTINNFLMKEKNEKQNFTTYSYRFVLSIKITAQNLVTKQIGYSSTTGQALPIEPYFGYSYSQSIYLSSEINFSGKITSIKYYYSGNGITKSNSWTVYIGHTNKSEFSSTADWVPFSQLTQVYNANISASVSGWITIDITDFDYNGSDNLVIAVDENTIGYDDDADEFYCTSQTNNRSIVYYNDSTNPNPSSPPTAEFIKKYTPNIIFNSSNMK